MTKEVMQQALDAFEIIFETTLPYRDDGECTFHAIAISTANKAIAALEAAIAQPVQPIGCVAKDGFTILYFQSERLPFETELYIKHGGAL